MLYYEVVTTCKTCDDEWTRYQGYDKKKAIEVCQNYRLHEGSDYNTELRQFRISKPFEEMSDDEQSGMYCTGYDTLEEEYLTKSEIALMVDRYLRKWGMSQSEFARRANVSFKTINKLMNDRDMYATTQKSCARKILNAMSI